MIDPPAQKRLDASVKAGLIILALLYVVAAFAEFIAPYDYREQARQEPSATASSIHFVDANGSFHLRPFIYESRLTNARELEYTEDTSREYPIVFFARGPSYNLLGLVRTDIHLFGLSAVEGNTPPQLHLLGTDQIGRDRFSRLLVATRFSLLVSPAGTILACLIGVIFGSVSGYSRKAVDSAMMAVADTVIALPTLILILAARAAFPLELPPWRAATLLVSIFALTGWAEMARLARGQVVAVKNREFITAARALGAGGTRILSAHVLPNIAGPLLVQATLILPAFFLAEVALSFLGVGLQEPEPSLGNMLTSASDLTQLSYHPFLLLSPAIIIFVFVLATRLLAGDAKRRWPKTPNLFPTGILVYHFANLTQRISTFEDEFCGSSEMEYYVFKDGQNLGPLPEGGVVDGLRSGRFQANDLGCRVGESNWQDLSILFPFEGQRQASPGRATGPVYQQPSPQPQAAYQQPAPMVQAAPNAAQANYPGGDFLLGQRFGALLIDAACAIPLVFMAVIPLVGIIGAPLLCGYWISRDSFFGGQSIGKKALGLKVIKPDGSPFTWADSVKRNIVYFGYLVLIIPWIGIFLNLIVNVPLAILELVMVLTNGQRLGDRQGGTYVVRA